MTSSLINSWDASSLISLMLTLPSELKQETVKYCCDDFVIVLDHLHFFKIPWTKYVYSYNHIVTWSTKQGYLPLLKWAVKSGCSCDDSRFLCECAAFKGHLEVLKWLMDNGGVCTKNTFSWAAYGGHLHVLQWLLQTGYRWDETTCSEAARGGHLEVLKWARANECHWNEETGYWATRKKHRHILQWLEKNDYPWEVPWK